MQSIRFNAVASYPIYRSRPIGFTATRKKSYAIPEPLQLCMAQLKAQMPLPDTGHPSQYYMDVQGLLKGRPATVRLQYLHPESSFPLPVLRQTGVWYAFFKGNRGEPSYSVHYHPVTFRPVYVEVTPENKNIHFLVQKGSKFALKRPEGTSDKALLQAIQDVHVVLSSAKPDGIQLNIPQK